MRMFSVADQRSIPEISVDTLIAVAVPRTVADRRRAGARGRAGRTATAARARRHRQRQRHAGQARRGHSGRRHGGAAAGAAARASMTLLTDQLADGTPVLVCDPEKVRTRAADLIKTGREFLDASWSVAAVGGDAPIDVEQLGGSGFRELEEVQGAARRSGHPWWTLSQLSDESAIELDIRAAPSARGPSARHRRDLRDAARARSDRRVRRRRRTGHRNRASRRRAAGRIRHAGNDVGAGGRAQARRRRRAQGPTARRLWSSRAPTW